MAWDDIFAKCFTAVNSVISLSSGIAIGMGAYILGIIGAIIILCNLVADVLCAVVDPRTRKSM